MARSDSNQGDNGPTEKQHYVPRFYLKRFANTNGFLHVLDRRHKALLPARPYSSVCYDSFYYAVQTGEADEISQQVERWLKRAEDYVSRNLSMMVEKISNARALSKGDRYALSVLFSMLWIRGPMMRNQIIRVQEGMLRQLIKATARHTIKSYLKKSGERWSQDEIDELSRYLESGDYEILSSNEQHLRFMVESLGLGDKGFANLFYHQRWLICRTTGSTHFITSDNPVIEWFAPPTGLLGRSFSEREFYLALTPEILLCLLPPEDVGRLEPETVTEVEEDHVMMYNWLIAERCIEYAYSDAKIMLERLLNGLQDPGRPELMYYDKFLRPYRQQ